MKTLNKKSGQCLPNALCKMISKKAAIDRSYYLSSMNTVAYYERQSINQTKLTLGYHDHNINELMVTYFNSSFFKKISKKKSQES